MDSDRGPLLYGDTLDDVAGDVQRTATALFFYPSCGDFQLSLREFHLSLIKGESYRLKDKRKAGVLGLAIRDSVGSKS